MMTLTRAVMVVTGTAVQVYFANARQGARLRIYISTRLTPWTCCTATVRLTVFCDVWARHERVVFEPHIYKV